MNNEDILNAVMYDYDQQRLVWRGRDNPMTGHDLNYNENFKGQPVKFLENQNGVRYIRVRKDKTFHTVSYSRALWVVISNDAEDHGGIMYFVDGDQDNTALNNMVWCHPLVATVLKNPMTGIREYQTPTGETLYRASVYNNAHDIPRVQQSGFASVTEATKWRIAYLRDHGAWWAVKMHEAYPNEVTTHDSSAEPTESST